MATILRTNKLLYSIKWQFAIIYLILVAIVFGLILAAVSSLVGQYLVGQRIASLTKDANSTAVQVAPYLSDYDANAMYDIAVKNSNDSGGRFLVLNSSGIVEVDSFSNLNGVKLSEREVNDILYGQNSSSYGFHAIDNAEGDFWAVYCTSSIIHNGEMIGAVLYSSSIQDVVVATNMLQSRMLWIFVLACGIIIVTSLSMTNLITKPIQKLTEVAIKISTGDLSQRANIKGRSEMAELAQTFDMMCGKIQNLDQQRSEFVSDASHELKTPLASMKILVESMLYQDSVPEEVYKDFLSDINNEIDRMNRLITDLLLLSKMDSDIVTINLETVRISSVVNKCMSALEPIASERNITLKTDLTDDFEIECDPLKLRQALNNLIENAIKYTGDDGHVSVSTKHHGGEGAVRIEDDGVGMSEDHLEHIFERFYRVDKARSRETGGTGLGLHIVRRIALMHGGRVDVQSTEGAGSVFTLVLPLVQNTES
ncbi:MAG: HAMP domain-containing sensor histidine kinase [Christensenella sp.]